MLAFEKVIEDAKISKIRLVASNKLLAESFRLLCLNKQIEFTFHLETTEKKSISFIKRVYSVLPLFLQAITSFGFNIAQRWPLRKVGLEEWKSTDGRITFISYFSLDYSLKAAFTKYYSTFYFVSTSVLSSIDTKIC